MAAAVLTITCVIAPTAARATTPPTVAVIGDSYAAGAGSSCGCQTSAWFQYTARDLGWTVGHVIADPGGGYVQSGTFGTFVQALTAHPLDAGTDYVLLQGGINDSNADPTTIASAVAAVLSLIAQQAPHAVVIVVGAFDPVPGHNYGSNQVPVARHIGDAAAIGSTRYTIGFMCTFDTTSDYVHPSSSGHQQIGDWVAWHIAHGLDNGSPLHVDPSGSYYTT